ncbi:MAG: phosphatase PAP2 family protein [Actinomycetota bacterium]
MTTLAGSRWIGSPAIRPALLLLVFFLLPVAGFALIVEEIAETERQVWDRSFVSSLSSLRVWWADVGLTVASIVGGGKGMLVIASAFIATLVVVRRYADALFVAVAINGAAVLGRIFKNTLDRARPEDARSVFGIGWKGALLIVLAIVAITWWTRWRRAGVVTGACFIVLAAVNGAIDLWQPTPGMDSFPSGHAVSSMAMIAAGVVLAWGTRARGPVLAVGALVLATAGLSRVYFGLHYPSDVLGGWALAVAWVGLLCGIRAAYRSGRWAAGRNERTLQRAV